MTEFQEMKNKSFSIMQENGETIDMAGDDIFKRQMEKFDDNVSSPSKRDENRI